MNPTLEHENQLDAAGRPSNKIYFASGELDESTLVKTGLCVIGGIVVNTDGVNDGLCVVYDGINDSGTIVARCKVKGADDIGGLVIPFRIATGIYVKLSGTGVTAQIYYL